LAASRLISWLADAPWNQAFWSLPAEVIVAGLTP